MPKQSITIRSTSPKLSYSEEADHARWRELLAAERAAQESGDMLALYAARADSNAFHKAQGDFHIERDKGYGVSDT